MKRRKADIVAEKGEDWYYENIYLPWKRAHEKRQQRPGYQEERVRQSIKCRNRRFERDPEYKKMYQNRYQDCEYHKERWKAYCKHYEQIENYDKAKTDNFKGWHCHHKLELHPDGSIRFTRESMIKADIYFNRPPEELIFLTISEHSKLHGKNRHSNE